MCMKGVHVYKTIFFPLKCMGMEKAVKCFPGPCLNALRGKQQIHYGMFSSRTAATKNKIHHVNWQ